MQVCVITHEGATAEESVPYLAAKWHPCPVVNFMCRHAESGRQIPRAQSLFYGWRDCPICLRLP